jgi:uncharacterized membrane protein YkvA (DUF1232 family)
MTMNLSFQLSDQDLRYFRAALKKSRNAVRYAEEGEIIDAIRDVLAEIQSNDPLPDFVALRIPVIEALIQMLTDVEWRLPKTHRERVLAVFMYFGDPEDILPDDIPVIGYLDDVIIVELVIRDLRHVLEAYDDFCQFRNEFDNDKGNAVDGAIRRDRIDRRRQQLHQRMQRRHSRQKTTPLW